MRFENGVPRKILSLKMGEVKVGWIKETMMTGSETRKAEKRKSSSKPEWKS